MKAKESRLRFMKSSKLRTTWDGANFVVRIYHPKGLYPRGRVAHRDALFYADDTIVFSVTRSVRWSSADKEAPCTEMDWLSLDELRLLGSIQLCERWGYGKVVFYPVPSYARVIDRRSLDLTSEAVAGEIRRLVTHDLHWPDRTFTSDLMRECLSLRYSFLDDGEIEMTRQEVFWNAISTSDYVLLRGLSSLFRSDMLSRHQEFFEEATMQCFVALDASFQLIVKKLKKAGLAQPTAKDAALWLHENFDSHLGFQAPLDRYFQEFYDQRVMTLHPASRLGETPYAPLMHDDYFHLRDSLRAIFAYLVSGKHDDGFAQAVAAYRS